MKHTKEERLARRTARLEANKEKVKMREFWATVGVKTPHGEIRRGLRAASKVVTQ